MPYDASLDKEIAVKEVDVDGLVFIVSLKSYNGGEAKISVSQKNSRFPVKRLTPKQFLAVAEAVRELAQAGGG